MFGIIPSTVAVIDLRRGLRLDHAALAAAVAARAAELDAADVRPDARVALCHGDGPAFLIDLFAIWRVGACAVCLAPSLTAGERDVVAAAVRPALWIGPPSGGGVAALPPADPNASGPPSALAGDRAGLDSPAVIMMTSGTTSRPKGVVHTHRSLQARLALNIAHAGAADLHPALTLLPMHFGHGLIGNCLTPLAAGATLAMLPNPDLAALGRIGALVDEHGIGFMSSVPALWRVILRMSPPPARGTLRRVHVGSAPLSAELWSAIGGWCGTRRIVNMYGITETANWIGGHDGSDGVLEDGLVGRLWGGTARLRGEDGALAERGRGEVMLATPSLMQGYLDEPALTAAALPGGWFATGDVGEIDAAGRLRIVGRLKHEINCGGIKVPAEEIDLLLERHPGVAEACAFPLADAVAGEVVAAAIVARDGAALDASAVKAWCDGRIRREAVPARLFVLGALPRTDRGKLNRDRVRAACIGGAA